MILSPNGKLFKEIQTYKIVKEADVIIPIAKLKTHAQTEMTIAIKKLKGLLTDQYKRKFHQRGGFKACVDLLEALTPQFALVDAIYCQEGAGPSIGKPIEMDLIITGHDLVAVDSVCGYIAGFEPREVPITAEAVSRGLGVADIQDIEVVGEPIRSISRRFIRPVEDERLKNEGCDVLYGGVTCSGCHLGLMHALFDLKETNQLKYLSGLTIVTGDPEIPYHVARDNIISVGNCVPRQKQSKYHITGCPPNIQKIKRGILERVI